MLKSILYRLLNLAAIAGAVGAIGFVVFQLAKSNVTVKPNSASNTIEVRGRPVEVECPGLRVKTSVAFS